MIVHISNEQKSLDFSTTLIPKLVEAVLTEENQSCEEVSLYFVDTPRICELHEEFFQDPTPTDCISFPMDEEIEAFEGGGRILGDVFVCPETALLYSKEHQVDPYEETTLYIVHGLLHLMGYDDLDDDSLSEMRAAEKRHMDHLKKLNLILKSVSDLK